MTWRLFDLSAEDDLPDAAVGFSGIGLMGGQGSANDPDTMTPQLVRFLDDAIARDIPIIGHCLGSQILARMFGAEIKRNSVDEIGWHDVEVNAGEAEEWFGQRLRFKPFHWHSEAFSLPKSAKPLLTATDPSLTANQAFAVKDLHIGLQCHVEIDLSELQTWCNVCAEFLPASSDASRQSADDILAIAEKALIELRPVTDAIYARWAQGLRL